MTRQVDPVLRESVPNSNRAGSEGTVIASNKKREGYALGMRTADRPMRRGKEECGRVVKQINIIDGLVDESYISNSSTVLESLEAEHVNALRIRSVGLSATSEKSPCESA